tara:strand:+ start:1943 stop:2173 length:231 start_codon:yes stop_codon:yes gene_type:complete
LQRPIPAEGEILPEEITRPIRQKQSPRSGKAVLHLHLAMLLTTDLDQLLGELTRCGVDSDRALLEARQLLDRAAAR